MGAAFKGIFFIAPAVEHVGGIVATLPSTPYHFCSNSPNFDNKYFL
jgi:hypothetical protein